MKTSGSVEKKWIHDMRSHLGVINAYLISTQHFLKKSLEKELFKNAQTSFTGLVELTSKLSDSLLSSENSIKDSDFLNSHIVKGQKNILVIDDDSYVRRQFSEHLGQKGITVITLEKGEDLLRHRIDFAKISSAIVDFNFDNSALDGFDIVEYLRSFHLKAIHLCTSQYDDPVIAKKAKDLGVTSIISKPLSDKVWTLF